MEDTESIEKLKVCTFNKLQQVLSYPKDGKVICPRVKALEDQWGKGSEDRPMIAEDVLEESLETAAEEHETLL